MSAALLKAPASALLAAAAAAHAPASAAAATNAIAHGRRITQQQPARAISTTAARTQRTGVAGARWFSSGRAHSAAGASSSRPLLLLSALAGGVLGGALLFNQEPAAAEAAPSTGAPLDALRLPPPADDSALPPVAALGALPSGSTGGKKKRKKKRSAMRDDLPYPGKFAHLHRDASSVVQVATCQGLRMQMPLAAFEQHPSGVQDKQVVIIPVLELGGQQGAQAQLIVHTNLGAAQKLEATWDTAGGATGSYKYAFQDGWARGLSVKPLMQMSPNGTMMGIDIDWKWKESAFTLSSAQLAELTMGYCGSLTRNLAAGVEVHHALQQFTHLNGGLRWTSDDRRSQVVVSKKESRYTATYYRRVSEDDHFITALTGGQQPFPPCTTELGVETQFNAGSQKSDCTIGVRHTRSTFVYHASLNANPSLALDIQMDPVMNLPMKFGINAAVPLDTANDAQIGISFMFQL